MTFEQISSIAFSFQNCRILLTAFELGVFTALGNGKKTSVAVAKKIRTSLRTTDRLMNALCAIGLLSKKNGLFFNTPGAARYLVAGRPDYMSNLFHTAKMWNTWSALTDAVKKGRSKAATKFDERSDEWFEPFIEAMHYRAVRQAKRVISLIAIPKEARVLDVGGGSGAYAMAFVKAVKGLKATVFDLPRVARLTKKYLRMEGMEKRVKVVAGDYNKDELGRGFDIIFLSAIVHSNSPSENIKLLRRCARALKKGGQVIVQDFVMNDDRTTPPFGAIFALNMLVATEHGDTYTGAEIGKWLKAAGFGKITTKDTGLGTTLITGITSQ